MIFKNKVKLFLRITCLYLTPKSFISVISNTCPEIKTKRTVCSRKYRGEIRQIKIGEETCGKVESFKYPAVMVSEKK